MRTPPAGLPPAAIADAVTRYWNLRVSSIRYAALGGGSYHWIARTAEGTKYFLTVDDLQAKPWFGADPDSAFRGLRTAFDTAVKLRDAAGLAFVLAPISALSGLSVCRLTPRHSLAVFPFIDGRPGQWGSELPVRDRDDLLGILAELHKATSTAGPGAPRRDVEVHERALLEDALADLEKRWMGGPFAERARRELASRRDAVTGWLTEFDDLAATLRRGEQDLVVTHGEPHPGNTMSFRGRLVLIDWDTVALAPPERDLWMLDDGASGQAHTLARYTTLTGRAVDAGAMGFYRLAWKLTDIAAFTRVLRSAHRRTRDTEHAWQALQIALSPAPPRPAGPACA